MRFGRWAVMGGVAVGASIGASACGLELGKPGDGEPAVAFDGGVPTDPPFFDGGVVNAPEFGTTAVQENAPPPISGGTLLVTSGGVAVAADPDRDAVFFVDVASKTKLGELALEPGDEPGRVVEDGHGRVHVALRRGGAVVAIDVATRTIAARRPVCPAPRGVALDAAADALVVACAGGELVTLPSDPTQPIARTVRLEHDLRDVVVREGKLFVTTFRTAQILALDADGKVTATTQPGQSKTPSGIHSPAVAFRTIATQHGLAMVHETGAIGPVTTKPGGYGGADCNSIVGAEVTPFDPDGQQQGPSQPLRLGVLPVDLAESPNGGGVAVVTPGNAKNRTAQLYLLPSNDVPPADPCGHGGSMGDDNQYVAVAWPAQGLLILQSREPARLVFVDELARVLAVVELSDTSRRDTGHDVFHASSGAGIACASCHPEGGDDGRTWSFEGIGPRRTQTFRGGLTGSEPFHWDGDQKDLAMLLGTVFVNRMSGPPLRNDQMSALSHWVDRIPAIAASAPVDTAAVARGETLFRDPAVGCASCHAGARYATNATVDVGTGGAFQVPSLHGLAFRAPYLHDGCAKTLLDRFGPCGGGDVHGKTSHLTPAQLGDLVAFLETL